MNPCYKNLQTQVIDEFEKRVDIILVDQEKLAALNNDKFKCTSRPKLLLVLEGKIIHEVKEGPNISDLEDNVRKYVPYIWSDIPFITNYFYSILRCITVYHDKK